MFSSHLNINTSIVVHFRCAFGGATKYKKQTTGINTLCVNVNPLPCHTTTSLKD